MKLEWHNPWPTAPGERVHLHRRVFHMLAASIFPTSVLLAPGDTPLLVAMAASMLLVCFDATRLAWPSLNRWLMRRFRVVFKPSEQTRFTGATYLAMGALAAVALFPAPVAALCLFYVAFGDPAAALVGYSFGRLRFSVSRGWLQQRVPAKSVEGSVTFLVVSLAVAAALWSLGVYSVFWPAAAGALVATLVEAGPLPLDDNLSVPLAAGTAMTLLWSG